MNDHEKDNEREEFLKPFGKSRSSGNDTPEDTPAIHRKQPLQEPRRSTLQMPPRPGSTSRQNSAPLSEYPVRCTQPTRKPGMYLSPKRKTAKKRRQRRLTIITVILVVVLVLSVLLIVKSCSSGGGDVLHGTWDLDGVTVYQFDGNGHGSLNLPNNTYPFTYEIEDNELRIDFESNAARDAAYIFSVKDGVLTMTGGEGTSGDTYELKKVPD